VVVCWPGKRTAVLAQQFYPSEEGSNSLADVPAGAHSPSGKPAVSVPHDAEPLRLPRGPRARTALAFGHQYQLVLSSPVSLRHGKGCTTFTSRNLAMSATNVTATVEITNTGRRAGGEVQFYTAGNNSRVSIRPSSRPVGPRTSPSPSTSAPSASGPCATGTPSRTGQGSSAAGIRLGRLPGASMLRTAAAPIRNHATWGIAMSRFFRPGMGASDRSSAAECSRVGMVAVVEMGLDMRNGAQCPSLY